MKIKVKKALSVSFITLGVLAVFFLFLNGLSPQIFTIQYLRFFMSTCFILTFSGFFVFKTGITPKSLWIRRSIMMGISCLTSLLSAYLFDIQSFLAFALPGGRIFIAIIVLSTIAYFIGDKLEKNNLQRINNKLKQMNDK